MSMEAHGGQYGVGAGLARHDRAHRRSASSNVATRAAALGAASLAGGGAIAGYLSVCIYALRDACLLHACTGHTRMLRVWAYN